MFQDFFNFLGDPIHRAIAITFVSLSGTFVLILGFVLGVLYCSRRDRKASKKKEQYRFDHSIQQPMRILKNRKQ